MEASAEDLANLTATPEILYWTNTYRTTDTDGTHHALKKMDHATAEDLTPTPVSFQNWVSIASSQFFKDDYVKHAINLAWELTNSLRQLVKYGHIELYQIAAEKITVHAAALQSIHSIKSVEFHDTPQTNPLLEIVAETIGEEPFSIYQPAVCVALGLIFFDLF